MNRNGDERLLLGEWACLGILYQGPTHGFAISARLRPDGDVGRVWSLSRPLTYRSLEQLVGRGYIAPIGEERGLAGPNRTVLAATRSGRSRFRAWCRSPVDHLRDLRSELLLKLVLADQCGLDVREMLLRQRTLVEHFAAALTADPEQPADSDAHTDSEQPADSKRHVDVVRAWRHETSEAALRFLDRITPDR
jgi:PadR family transcriptional regulator AphA